MDLAEFADFAREVTSSIARSAVSPFAISDPRNRRSKVAESVNSPGRPCAGSLVVSSKALISPSLEGKLGRGEMGDSPKGSAAGITSGGPSIPSLCTISGDVIAPELRKQLVLDEEHAGGFGVEDFRGLVSAHRSWRLRTSLGIALLTFTCRYSSSFVYGRYHIPEGD